MSPLSRILLVEDDEAHAELVSRAFESYADRFELLIASDLDEAISLIDSTTPELVITDLRLPAGSGLELLADPAEGATHAVVVMTSQGDEGVAVEAMKRGALDYIVKSESVFLELPRIVERALREWRYIVDKRRAETELRQREAELRHAQKMEALGRIASGAAHDFNNVLMGISGCADVAIAKLDHPEQARTFLEEIRRSARSAASIAGRLLAFSRPRAEAPEVLEIDKAVHETADMLGYLLGKEVALELALEANACVRIDPGELAQVIMNLAVNARDAMPQGGKLSLKTELFEVTPQYAARHPGIDPGLYVMLSVVDTGCGMDEQTLAHACDPFFTTKEVGKGTGLGLSTVYGVVRASGGRLDIDSRVGVGTTVRICLPATNEAPNLVISDAPPRSEHSKKTVLLVEDEPIVRLALRHYLEQCGCRVLEAFDHDSAVAQADTHLDLMVTDVMLPGGGGKALADAMRKKGSRLKVLYVSAHPRAVLEREGRIEEGAPLLQKPFSEEAFARRVQELLLQSEEPAPHGASVLLVEDHGPARLATAELLSEEGFEIIAAANGADALSACCDRRFDAVVMDIGLPDVSGDALVERIREKMPDIGVVFLSGRDSRDPDVQRALQCPHTAFVQKPIRIEIIAETLGRVLAR